MNTTAPHYNPQHWARGICTAAIGKRVWSAIIAIISWTVLTAQAQCQEKSSVVFGAALESCGEYLRAAEGERKARPAYSEANAVYSMSYLSFSSYADGWLSRANVENEGRSGENTDLSGRMAWLENYCRQNPLTLYVNALEALRGYLAKHRQ